MPSCVLLTPNRSNTNKLWCFLTGVPVCTLLWVSAVSYTPWCYWCSEAGGVSYWTWTTCFLLLHSFLGCTYVGNSYSNHTKAGGRVFCLSVQVQGWQCSFVLCSTCWAWSLATLFFFCAQVSPFVKWIQWSLSLPHGGCYEDKTSSYLQSPLRVPDEKYL